MKKLFFIACFALAAVTAANAQWYVGGNVSYARSSSTSERTGQEKSETTNTGFEITPRVGYIFNDRWSVGLGLGYKFAKQAEGDNESKQDAYSVSPYARFNVFYFGPFSIAAEAMAGYGKSKFRPMDPSVKSSGADVFSAKLSPVLELDASKNLTLECRLDFFSIGYYSSKWTAKYEDGTKDTHKHNDFSAGVKGDEIFTTGKLTFGMIYKF